MKKFITYNYVKLIKSFVKYDIKVSIIFSINK